MRTLLLLALALVLGAACSDEPMSDATSAGPTWLTERPEDAMGYADDTLSRFRKLVDGDGWRDPAWNAQGTLEATHEKTGLVFVLVPAGEFMMGSPATETDREDDETQHLVTVPAFLLCRMECTEEAWDRIGGEDDRRWIGPDLPIETVTWKEADSWCRKVGLRLPSEAEWEHACRAGTKGRWCFGDDKARLLEYAWYDMNSATIQLSYDEEWDLRHYSVDVIWQTCPGVWMCSSQAVGELKPNAIGMHDMHGNVSEWCEDWWEKSYDKTPRDGTAHAGSRSGDRIHRGGSWSDRVGGCRSANRGRCKPGYRLSNLGFRPAASLPPK